MKQSTGEATDGIPPHLRRRVRDAAREQRRKPTRSEALLWSYLRNRSLHGIKFRRQEQIGPFIADFFASEYRLVIEIDGPVHELQKDRDVAREDLLKRNGYRVIRFSSADVEHDIEGVCRQIVETISALDPPSPTAVGEGAKG